VTQDVSEQIDWVIENIWMYICQNMPMKVSAFIFSTNATNWLVVVGRKRPKSGGQRTKAKVKSKKVKNKIIAN
jgi:hypothetical protein